VVVVLVVGLAMPGHNSHAFAMQDAACIYR
jgi:hypothetical protein